MHCAPTSLRQELTPMLESYLNTQGITWILSDFYSKPLISN
jgi:hypothetical protein